jgi:hypothetical protein
MSKYYELSIVLVSCILYSTSTATVTVPAAAPVTAPTHVPVGKKAKKKHYTVTPTNMVTINLKNSEYPYFPTLRKGADEKVCQFVLNGVRQIYKSRSPSLALMSRTDRKNDIADNVQLDYIAEEVAWDHVFLPFEVKDSDILYKAELDIDGAGNRQVVVYRDKELGWRGSTYSLYVFKSEKLFNESIYASNSMDELVAKGAVIYDGSWKMNNVFIFNDKYYVLDEGNDFAMETDISLTVRKIKSEGRTEVTCVIDYYNPMGSPSGFDDSPDIKVFLKTLSIMGDGGSDCGTLHSGARHENGVRGLLLRTKTRPWASGHSHAGGYYVYNSGAEEFIRGWGDGDPWSRREYFTHLENEYGALIPLADYLEKTYKLDRVSANEYANHLLKNIIVSHFLIPHDFENYLWSGGYEDSKNDARLRHELEMAVDKPHEIASLIKEGANINGQNWFGKTALMYAAHLNQINAVNILIEHGANVNLSTTSARYGCRQLSRTGRTALMYAAENSSIPIMKILISAGANINATDSVGNNVDYYLRLNPRFSTQEKGLGLNKLIDKYKTSNQGIDPGFNCDMALSRIERTICGDDALKIYDHDLAIAYVAWLKISKNTNSAEQQQRDWLRRRQQECDSLENDDDHKLCIQDDLPPK